MKIASLTETYRFGTDRLLAVVEKGNVSQYLSVMEKDFRRTYRAEYLHSFEWVVRTYRSAKHVLGSATFYCQAEHLGVGGFANLSTYLMYYSTYHAVSAVLLMMPHLKWSSLELISHADALTKAKTELSDRGLMPENFQELYNFLLANRETFSYKLPLGSLRNRQSSGLPTVIIANNTFVNIVPAIIQLANLLSHAVYKIGGEIFQHVADQYDIYQSEADQMFFSSIEIRDRLGQVCALDDDDYRRLGWMARQGLMPIDWFITEKLCEDLECGWWERTVEEDFDINSVGRAIAGWLK